MTEAMVELRDATIGYESSVVLQNIDFTLSRGEYVAIVGANGSGKSTLIKSILGLAAQHSGSLELFGRPAAQVHERWRIGYVPQRLSVGGPIPATVREVVASGRLARRGLWRRGNRADREAIDHALSKTNITSIANRTVGTLSGGQQRRVLIARALASQTDVLILDEPTAGVDVEAQAALADVLGQLSREGTTIALVTHDLDPFTEDLTRVVWVSRGSIEYDGPPTSAIVAAASEPFPHHHHEDELPTHDSGPMG
jgi:zinc transport system ATP-binding protein